jgi:hypothetical protein
MESSDYTRLDYKTINEFFPKGQLSILAAGEDGENESEGMDKRVGILTRLK